MLFRKKEPNKNSNFAKAFINASDSSLSFESQPLMSSHRKSSIRDDYSLQYLKLP